MQTPKRMQQPNARRLHADLIIEASCWVVLCFHRGSVFGLGITMHVGLNPQARWAMNPDQRECRFCSNSHALCAVLRLAAREKIRCSLRLEWLFCCGLCTASSEVTFIGIKDFIRFVTILLLSQSVACFRDPGHHNHSSPKSAFSVP